MPVEDGLRRTFRKIQRSCGRDRSAWSFLIPLRIVDHSAGTFKNYLYNAIAEEVGGIFTRNLGTCPRSFDYSLFFRQTDRYPSRQS